MINTRKEFLDRYIEVARKSVRCYIVDYVVNTGIHDDMFSEACLRVVKAGIKFHHDDIGQEAYVAKYIRRSVHTACVDVVRSEKMISRPRDNESKRISDFSDKNPTKIEKSRAGCRRLCVYNWGDGFTGEPFDPTSVFEIPEGLFEQILRKRVVDWAEFFSDTEATILKRFVDSYPRGREPATNAQRVTRRKLIHRVRRIVIRYIEDHVNPQSGRTAF